ncbi:MAG: asparagine synthase C-terminal domain-containing protein [Candidatus Hodarchaeota archaeon]
MDILERRLKQIISDQNQTNSIGLLYSGGLDSTIIAQVLLSQIPLSSLNIVCVGFRGSHDMENASFGAKKLGFELNRHFLTLDLIKDAIIELRMLNIIDNPVHLAIAIPLFLGMQFLKRRFQTRNIFLGQGADELFGGYKRYSLMYDANKIEDISIAMENDLKSLLDGQISMEKGLADYFGVNLIYPYLDPEIIEYARSYPIRSHIISTKHGEITRKVLLRGLAKKLGLPDSIVTQQKKAIQYGSGTVKALRKIAKNQGYANFREWFDFWFIKAKTF